jgi:hypothetical protein
VAKGLEFKAVVLAAEVRGDENRVLLLKNMFLLAVDPDVKFLSEEEALVRTSREALASETSRDMGSCDSIVCCE